MAKEYIEREALIELANNHVDGVIDAYDIALFPTADVVEVVRCKDCKFRHDSCFAGVGNTYCDVHHKYFPLDGFCSYGERRDSE